jgi:hypothetical protein
MLPFGHAASETTGTIDIEDVNGDGRGYPMPRAGWILSLSARADIPSLSGGTADAIVYVAAVSSGLGVTFDSTDLLQIKTARLNPPKRFAAGARIHMLVDITPTITIDDFLAWVEIELER